MTTSTLDNKEKPRVVLCGTGFYGCLVGRTAMEHGYTVVAALNRAGDKVGQNIGRLAGLDQDLGVVVQDIDQVDFNNLDADIGVVTQTNDLNLNLPTYRRLMNAGMNVLCLAMEAYYPFGSDPESAAEIDELAKQNGVTFTGSGIHDMSRIWSGIFAAGLCTHIDTVAHTSMTDGGAQGTPLQLERDYGHGNTVEQYLEKGIHQNRLWPVFTDMAVHVLSTLGYTVTNKKSIVEPVVWDEPCESPYLNKIIPAGRVLGTRVKGYVETREGVTGTVIAEGREKKPEEFEHTHWVIKGRPGTEVTVRRINSDYTNAAALFNRIKGVIAAEPGIVPVSKLGPILAPELQTTYR